VVHKQTRLAVAAALVLFGYLAAEVWRGQAIGFDASIRDAIHAWASPPLTFAMRGVTWFGSSLCLSGLAALVVCLLVARGRTRAAIVLVVASAGAEALDQVLKFVFQRARPQAFFDFVHPIGYSFPSGHSIASCCFYGVLAAILAARQPSRALRAAIWTVAALLALGIGFSRIYLGVHYPSDVLAGYAAALVWLGAVRAGYEFWLRRQPTVKEVPNR
jgi:undecaprenyl-diphosphatase